MHLAYISAYNPLIFIFHSLTLIIFMTNFLELQSVINIDSFHLFVSIRRLDPENKDCVGQT